MGERRTIFLGWGRGTGKSHFLRTVCWLRVAEWDGKLRTKAQEPFRGVRIAWLMPARKQFVDVHGASILQDLEPGGKYGFLGGKVNRATWHIDFPGGSTLMPFPAADANSKTARGIRADILVVDEGDDVDTSVYDSVAIPWLSARWSLGEELIAGTPTRGRHGLWFRTLKWGRLGERIRRGEAVPDLSPEETKAYASIYPFLATYVDTPETVDPVAVAKAKATTPPSIFKREWLADPDSAEGLVFGDVFVESFHVRSPPQDVTWTEILIGCDHGTEDPGCLLLVGVIGHGNDATAWVIDEVYESHRLEGWWTQQLKRWTGWYPNHRFYGDPSRPGTVEAYRLNAGARVQEVDNSIEDGINAVADRFVIREREDGSRFARLYVSPKCVNLIAELGKYRRKADPRDKDRYLEDILDRWNHSIDALRYCLFNRFDPRSRAGKRNTRSLEERSS